MIKLVYDLRAGFDDCYLTVKDESYDLTNLLENYKEDEATFYAKYKDDLEPVHEMIQESNELDRLYEDSVVTISKLYFSHKLKPGQVVPIWEPANFRLVWEPWNRSSSYYHNAMSAKEVCTLLKLTRQQLYYYVATGAIKKEYNPDKQNSFKYNRTDVYVLQKKLEKKYEKYKQ